MKKWILLNNKALFIIAINSCITLPCLANIKLEEVIVTTQKREQNIQDVPLSIQALTGKFIVQNNIARLDDLAQFVPNLIINENLVGNVLNIRGINSGVSNSGFEQSVATFIDGVYFGRARQSVVPLMDLERVEVIRGPQPIFFGQSAIAGSLNLNTQKPTTQGTWQGQIKAGIGTESENYLQFAAGGPVSHNTGVRIAGRTYQWDGFMTNSVTGEDFPQRDNDTLRLSTLYDNENTQVFLKLETSDQEQIGIPAQIIGCNNGGISPSAPPFLAITGNVCSAAISQGLNVEYNLNSIGSAFGNANQALALGPNGLGLQSINDTSAFEALPETLDTNNGLLQFDHNFNAFTLTSSTSFSDYDSFRRLDIDNTPIVLFTTDLSEEYEQVAQEFRISSIEPYHSVDWMIGTYYQDSELNTSNNPLITPIPQLFVSSGVSHTEENTWLSAFTALTIHLNSSTRIGVGLRYTEVDKRSTTYATESTRATIANPNAGNPTVPPPLSGPVMSDYSSQQFILSRGLITANASNCLASNTSDPGICFKEDYASDDVNYSLDLQHDLNTSTLIYAKVSNAFKAGGFNVGNSVAKTLDAYIFDDEEADSYEAGIKTSHTDFQVNITLFKTEYKNQQVSSYDPATLSFNVGNAGKASTEGIEIDGKWIISDQVILNFSGALLDAKYDDFAGAQCSDFERGQGINNCHFGTIANPNFGQPGQTPTILDPEGALTNRAGYDLQYAPEVVLNLGGEYTLKTSNNLALRFSTNLNYSDEYFVNDRYDPRGKQDSYTKVDVGVSLENADKTWQLSLLGRNITDEELIEIYGPSSFNGRDSAFLISSRGESYSLNAQYNF